MSSFVQVHGVIVFIGFTFWITRYALHTMLQIQLNLEIFFYLFHQQFLDQVAK